MRDVRERLQRAWAWLLSFRRKSWTLRDYPLRWREFENSGFGAGGLAVPEGMTPVKCSVQILGWTTMHGHGNSRDEARADLEKFFARYAEAGKTLPRPGTYVEMEIASRAKVESYATLQKDFEQHILNVEWAFLTDQSSLGHFTLGQSKEDMYRSIEERYGVDVSDVEDGNLTKIFERIAAARRKR